VGSLGPPGGVEAAEPRRGGGGVGAVFIACVGGGFIDAGMLIDELRSVSGFLGKGGAVLPLLFGAAGFDSDSESLKDIRSSES